MNGGRSGETGNPPAQGSPEARRRPHHSPQPSMSEDLDTDPWRTPAKAAQSSTVVRATNTDGMPDHATQISTGSMPQRTTSAFSTHGGSPSQVDKRSTDNPTGNGSNPAWNSYNGSSGASFTEQPTLGGGFGDPGDNRDDRDDHNPGRSLGAGAAVIGAGGEVVTISMLPDKDGIFLFQHRNYEVKSTRRASTVVRRYSDFVWLLECLQKRYPFRRLPLLPPKRVQGMPPEG